MVLAGAQVKITDFGVARLGDLSGTQIGAVIGTPKYMAPEQALGKPVDHRADLFAAGALFYQMLAGKPAFSGDTPDEIVARVIHAEPNGLAEEETQRYPMLTPLFERALAKDPAQRFPSAEAFAAALRQAVGTGDDSTRIALRPALDPDTVVEAEKALANHIGPLARILVKKAAGTATSQMQLYEAVAGSIADETARSAFLRRAAATASGEGSQSGTTGTRAPTQSGPPVTPEAMAAAQEALTFFLGPIARILVRKAAEAARGEVQAVERGEPRQRKPQREGLDRAHQAGRDTEADQGASDRKRDEIAGKREHQRADDRHA
jgi:serine/threonine-protein kinase